MDNTNQQTPNTEGTNNQRTQDPTDSQQRTDTEQRERKDDVNETDSRGKNLTVRDTAERNEAENTDSSEKKVTGDESQKNVSE